MPDNPLWAHWYIDALEIYSLWDYSLLHKKLAMDLGTANTIIITGGKIVVDEPSVVALDRRTDKMML